MLNSEQLQDPTSHVGPILLNGTQCSGDEPNLFSCSNSVRINEYNSCLHATDVSIICNGMLVLINDCKLQYYFCSTYRLH